MIKILVNLSIIIMTLILLCSTVAISLNILFKDGTKIGALSLTAGIVSLGLVYTVLRFIYRDKKETK